MKLTVSHRFSALSAALVLSLASSACLAQAPVVDVDTSSAQSTTNTANQSASAGDLASRVAVIERITESRSNTQQRMQQQLDMLQSDVDSIRGSIELHNHQLEKILERQRELFLELDKRFENLQNQSASVGSNINSVGTDGSVANNTGLAASTSAPAVGEQESYQNAVNLILKERDYESAVPAFQTFLSQYPNSDLTDNAHYWLGQLLYNNQDWNAAKEQFMQVATRFMNSPKRADSLLKLGMIAKSQGNPSQAREYFEQVVSEYPNSTPARLSNEQLAQG